MLRLRTAVALSALLIALTGCATTARSSDPYAEVNRSLRGERAIVELSGGEVARGVSQVRLSETKTTWIEEHRTRQVPTDQVSRVIVVTSPQRAPWGLVLLAGIGLSYLFDDALPFAIAVDVALEPFVWGADVSPRLGRVVYAPPLLAN